MPGEWEVVYTNSERLFGFSSITREPANNCAVKEELLPERSSRPVEIISRFDTEIGAHTQVLFGMAPTHVSTQEVEADGTIAFEGTAYNLSDSANNRQLRLIYTALPEGGFRHQGFVSADEGQNWRLTLDITYRSIRDDEQ